MESLYYHLECGKYFLCIVHTELKGHPPVAPDTVVCAPGFVWCAKVSPFPSAPPIVSSALAEMLVHMGAHSCASIMSMCTSICVHPHNMGARECARKMLSHVMRARCTWWILKFTKISTQSLVHIFFPPQSKRPPAAVIEAPKAKS